MGSSHSTYNKYNIDHSNDKKNKIDLNNLDLAMTPIDKLKCFVDCFKTIVNVLALTNDKGESAGADDSLPLSIYVLLKAAPQRLYSNIK